MAIADELHPMLQLADGSRIELDRRKRLRYLLAKFCQQDTIVPLPTLPSGRSRHDIT